MRYLILFFLVAAQTGWSEPREIDDHRWEGVERIVAIGDIHGDYDNYMAALRLAGIVNQRGRWAAGNTHLVQLGDIPGRGPQTRRIINHLSGLARQAQRAGGRVHHLIGNHEAMNVYGDLRYVLPEEFEAFATHDSERLRDQYFSALIDHLRETAPDRYASLPEDFRQDWNDKHPLGWVEHRMAWDPRWNPDGEMFHWVMSSRVAVQLNDMVFVHGGISRDYCRHDLASLTRMVHETLQLEIDSEPGILVDERGPLWYRGLAGMEPATPQEVIQAILDQYGASHIVIAHTPTGGIIWPRHSASIIQIDTGMSAHYGGHIAWLEFNNGTLFAGYPGGLLELPLGDEGRTDYLQSVMAMQPENSQLHKHRKRMARRAEPTQTQDELAADDQSGTVLPPAICGNAQ